jgi:hypothetical protein
MTRAEQETVYVLRKLAPYIKQVHALKAENAALKAEVEKFNSTQHTQPAICAWLKANSMCSKWGASGAKICIACEAPRKQQASA